MKRAAENPQTNNLLARMIHYDGNTNRPSDKSQFRTSVLKQLMRTLDYIQMVLLYRMEGVLKWDYDFRTPAQILANDPSCLRPKVLDLFEMARAGQTPWGLIKILPYEDAMLERIRAQGEYHEDKCIYDIIPDWDDYQLAVRPEANSRRLSRHVLYLFMFDNIQTRNDK